MKVKKEQVYQIPDLYRYLDYRKFLKEFYRLNKQNKSYFSHRFIAQKVGFKSSGLLIQIFNNQTNITETTAEQFAVFLGLDSNAKRYFHLLVRYNQQKAKKQKEELLEELLLLKRTSIKEIDKKEYSFYKKWYYVVVRELLNIYPFKGDYKRLAKKVMPEISTEEAYEAVEALSTLGLVEQGEDQVYRLNHPLTSTGKAVKDPALHDYHLKAIELGKRSVLNCDPNERQSATITCSISPKIYQTILKEMEQIRRRIMEAAKNGGELNRVYQINMQIFPVSKVVNGE